MDLDAVPHWRNYWSSKALTKGIPRTARRLKPGKAAPEARLEVAWIATLPDSPASRRTHGRRLSEQRLDNEAGAGFAPSGELRAEAEALQWRSRTWTARQSGLLRSTTWWWPRHWSRSSTTQIVDANFAGHWRPLGEGVRLPRQVAPWLGKPQSGFGGPQTNY